MYVNAEQERMLRAEGGEGDDYGGCDVNALDLSRLAIKSERATKNGKRPRAGAECTRYILRIDEAGKSSDRPLRSL